ncbi:MAG TPA: wax ester/triacylglycerol synthase family O-acyltransferase [Candidatus Dormibacteraeota bacterium]|nr:wax ester/triacylglycerol synthase family O-acyltransferase [Candidatus Dormibacteraeota bacterium]
MAQSEGGGTVTRPYFEPLVGIDTWFLYAERHEAPLHIGATYIFEGTPRVKGARGALGLARTIEERLHLVPRYRQKLMWPPGGVGNPVWVDDADFDLSFHVRRAALPSPGDDDTLRDYVARVFARPLDLDKPLWEVTIVEGLTGGRVAVVNKVHHAMVDGISTVDLATLLLDVEPEPTRGARPRRWKARPAPDRNELLAYVTKAMSPLELLKDITKLHPREVLDAVLRSPWTGGLQLALSWLRPGTPLFFNQPIGPHRRVQSVKVPLQWFKDVKTAFGGTVNDVVLAVIGEAMSRWLDDRGDAIPESLRVFAPVSVRDETQRYRLGNLVSAMVINVPLAPMLPKDRVHMVTAATGDLKRTRQAVAAQTLTQIATWAPATVQNLAGTLMTSQMRWSPQSVINLVVTNIPGPQIPFYTGGAELLDVWPFVSIYHSLGLNIAVVSYNGSVFFGVLADRDLVPDLDDFARHLERSASDYHESATKPARKSGRRTTRPRQKAAKQPVDLGVHHEPVVAAPNGDRRDVRPKTAAKVHDLV